MRYRSQVSLAILALLAGSACGTRVEDRSAETAASGSPSAAVSSPTPEVSGSPDGGRVPMGESPVGPASGPVQAEGGGAAAGPSGARTGGGASASSAAQGGPAAQPGVKSSAVPQRTGSAAPAQATAPGGSPAPAPSPGVPIEARSPIIVASVGTYTGPVGSSLKPILDGAQLWTKDVNHRGGINGHPVNLIVYDDGGDPARHRAQVQEAVEQRRAIGFLSNGETITGRGSIDYITSKRVPVIGTDGGENWPYESPMYFPQASTGDALYGSFMPATAERVIPAGKRKLGTVVCEVQTCTEIKRVMDRDAKAVGFDHVYNGQASIAQPDYTAECLAARNSGVEVLFLVLDTNSIFRFVASCARQGFRPQYSAATALVADRFKEDENFEGFVAGTPIFPYFQTGSPATDEFQAALKAFGRGLGLHIGLGVGWTAGKLLEKAARNMPEPPTSHALLEGLWSIQDDTLGGITMPLSFVRDKPPTPRSCWFQIEMRNRTWLSPNGFRLSCRQ